MKPSSLLNNLPVNVSGDSPARFPYAVLKQTLRPRRALLIIPLLVLAGYHPVFAYEDYSGCESCHGNFRGATSTKGTIFPNNNNHDMHRNSANMGTACNLCHSGSSRVPTFIGTSTGTANNQGLGCTGCHVSAGLRAHHVNNGVTECLDCHDAEAAPPENVKPPYYGTPDTKANNPGNTVQAANTNENWSVGDFLGLDNDGNNLYDLADYAIGPFRLLSASREGNHMRLTWLTAGGRTNTVQAATAVNGTYSNLSARMVIPGVGLVTTNFLDVGGATNLARFYRLVSVGP
ncbi:MAG: hypothetical protein KJ070_10730 [Verrucomicrobia bacterium]|nr:hypothetical protein [Verrucomicrobiota bacterium]